MDYKKMISNIPDLSEGDLIMTNSYDFVNCLSSKQNLIYVNDFRDFMDHIKPDWIIAVDANDEYITDFLTEKGACILTNDIDWLLNSKHLRHLYEVLGFYTYKIIVFDNQEFKYFIILKKRCCSRCKYRNSSCCDENENEDENKHDKTTRFDFLNYI